MRRWVTAACTAAVALATVGLLGFGAVGAVAPRPQVVRPGGVVAVRGAGFAPRGAVTLGLAGARGVRTLHADTHGRVATTYRAPRHAGHYRLLLVGAPPHARAPAPPVGRGRGDHQVVEVVVPRLVIVAFVVRATGGRPSSGTGPGQTSRHPGGGDGGASSASGAAPRSGNPAVTGADVGLLTLVAVVLVAGGVLLTRAGVRPRRR